MSEHVPLAAAGAQSLPVVLQACGLTTGHGAQPLARGVSLALHAAQVVCLLGPNGAGKTTLFRTLLGLLPALAGQVLVQGRPVQDWPRPALAGQVGYVPQAQAGLFAFSALDMVLMGRAARLAAWSRPSRADTAVARACLDAMGIAALGPRAYTELSGGERQLVLIARALAQEPALLIMDEPTASLDFGNQIRVLERIGELRQRGIAVLMSTHQPEHALQVADTIALLGREGLQALGPARATATPAALAQLYGVPVAAVMARLFPDGRSGWPAAPAPASA